MQNLIHDPLERKPNPDFDAANGWEQYLQLRGPSKPKINVWQHWEQKLAAYDEHGLLTAFGRAAPVSQWAQDTGLEESLIRERLEEGCGSEESALRPACNTDPYTDEQLAHVAERVPELAKIYRTWRDEVVAVLKKEEEAEEEEEEEEEVGDGNGQNTHIGEGTGDSGNQKGSKRTTKEKQKPPPPLFGRDAKGFYLDANGKRIKDEYNARRAFELEGVSFQYDEFSYEDQITGFKGHGPALTDIAEKTLWALVWSKYGMKFMQGDFRDIIDVAAWKNKVHPVRAYFAAVQPTWDRMPRIDTWAIDYLGVPDTKVNRFICRKSLIANVRRARQPGVKFDTMTTLEGPQDYGKSSALRTLCPREEWFTDNFAFNHKSGREDITQSQGKFMIEIPELSGMKPTAVHHTKALLSRQFDECDMKYEKRATRRGRQACFWGTTNEHAYLFDETGNRRIWPLPCGVTRAMADLEGLAAVRDQLWAEAAHYEATGEAIHATAADMKEELATVTELRQVRDEWEPIIRDQLITIKDRCERNYYPVRATISEMRGALAIQVHEFDRDKQIRIRQCMIRIGWALTTDGRNGGPKKRDGRELWEPAKVGWDSQEDEENEENELPF